MGSFRILGPLPLDFTDAEENYVPTASATGRNGIAWVPLPSATSPGGGTGAIQFNTAGVFDGDASNFSFDSATQTLRVLGAADYWIALPAYSEVGGTAGATFQLTAAGDATNRLNLFSSGGTLAAPTPSAVGTTVGTIDFNGFASDSAVASGVRIAGAIDATPGAGIVPGRMELFTADNAGTLIERVRINSAGCATFFNHVNMASLPTSATGLPPGELWNNAGTLKIA